MQSTLTHLLTKLGIEPKPRYTAQETADILGIRWDQMLGLLKRGKIIGIRASERRWIGVLADDLSAYLDAVNAPRERKTPIPTKVTPPMEHVAEDATRNAPPMPPMPLVTDMPDTPPMEEVPPTAPPLLVKPHLGF